MTAPMTQTLNQEQIASLVAVAKAHAVRAHCRDAAKTAKVAQEEATKDCMRFGRYADCGPSYDAALDTAKGVFSTAVSAKISAERAYKKVKLTAVETHPGLAPIIEVFVQGVGA
jgi:hypothetical protein